MKYLKPLLATSLIIAIIFVIASLFDIILIFIYPRFYSTAAFNVTFAVGGIFAGTISYIYGMERFVEKNKTSKWLLISFSILTGLFFFFPLAKLEGGEYEAAFKAFGAMLASSSLLFVKGKPG